MVLKSSLLGYNATCFHAGILLSLPVTVAARELSSLARTLGSWMFCVCMRLFCVSVVLCLRSGLATS
jgi:hypothetical protein